MSLQLIYFSFFSGRGTLVEAATAFMFMNCCFCGSPQHNLISKGQGQLQGLDFYQGMIHLYRVCLYSMIVHTTITNLMARTCILVSMGHL